MGIFSAALAMFGANEPSKSGSNGKPAQPAPPPPGTTILVIDDDTNLLETMRSLLRDAGYNVLTSANGPKGLDMLRYAPGGVRTVLLDYNMPGFNGAETLAYLRKLSPNAKVIAISGFKVSELPKDFQENVQRFIAKPFTNTQLLETIQEVLAERPDDEVPTAASA